MSSVLTLTGKIFGPWRRFWQRRRGERLLVGLVNLHVAVTLETGTGGNRLTDDDVLLQAQQRIHLALDGGFGEHASGLLEGGGGEEGFGG